MRSLIIIFCAVLVLFAFSQTQATIIHVPGDSSTIQKGIAGTCHGDTVLVAPGIYYESLGTDTSIVLASEFLLTGDSSIIDCTIIQGSGGGNGIQLHGQDSTSLVTGFTITGWGNAIRCYSNCAANTIACNHIIDNGHALAVTGGIRVESGSHSRVMMNVISNNYGSSAGAILCYSGSAPSLIKGNIVRSNSGDNAGGIEIRGIPAIIEDNLIVQNVGVYAGAIYSEDASPTIENNTIYNNTGVHGGGIYHSLTGTPTIKNNIICGSADGAGIYYEADKSGIAVIRYNDVWNNVDGNYGGDCPDQTGINGNISEDPLFCDPQSDNFHLFNISPCVGAGENGEDIGALSVGCLLGDSNGDGVIDLGDVVYLINYLYKNGPAPHPLWVGDCNCDEVVNLGDVVFLINYLFKGGPPPCEP